MTNQSKSFKIGIDFHGVIDAMPEFFSFFTDAILKSGGEIHILTGGLTSKDKQTLQDFNIKYTHLFSITDYHTKIGTPTTKNHPKYGFPMISDYEWDKTKADYCRRESIDFHIDDTLAYNEFFSTPFCRLWTHNNHPKSDAKDERHLS